MENFWDLFYAGLISISPFGELKVGLPMALSNKDIPIWLAYIVCCVSNALITPLMYVFLDWINFYFMKWKFYRKVAFWLAIRARNAAKNNISKYGYLGLAVFVLIPLPGTGAYMGTIAAYIFNFKRLKSWLYISIGVFIAGGLVASIWKLGEAGLNLMNN